MGEGWEPLRSQADDALECIDADDEARREVVRDDDGQDTQRENSGIDYISDSLIDHAAVPNSRHDRRCRYCSYERRRVVVDRKSPARDARTLLNCRVIKGYSGLVGSPARTGESGPRGEGPRLAPRAQPQRVEPARRPQHRR